MNEMIHQNLCNICGQTHVRTEEPMKAHTTFRIGGPADFFVCPEDTETLTKVISCCRANDLPFFILGNGSNLLVSDRGYRGVVIQICHNLQQISVKDTVIHAQAGALLSAVAREAFRAGLTGLEFASGIPGTLGGGVRMNAGAYGGELKDVLLSVEVLDNKGQLHQLPAEELQLGYRTSLVEQKEWTVISADLQLRKGDPNQILARMDELKEARCSKQPLEYPSAGSTFKRPEGYFAGKLIQDAGLRGFSVGDAQVAEKHCGFVINKGKATAAEVDTLIKEVSRRVEEAFSVHLVPEVRFLGEFPC